MRFSHLLPLLGLAWAAPTQATYPSIFDNPSIPWDTSDSDELPGLSHARRATLPPPPPPRPVPSSPVPTTTVNLTSCFVTLNGDQGWLRQVNVPVQQQGHLYIVEGIPSPGTKNGANLYDIFLQFPDSYFGFATNQYVMGLPYRLGPKNNDYALVSVSPDGRITANVDYSNLDNPNPGPKAPLTFNAEVATTADYQYGPRQTYPALGGGVSGIWVTLKDKGALEGRIGLSSYPYNGAARYFASITGACLNSRIQIPTLS